MDQATREGRPAVSATGDETIGEQKAPEELRREIEQTREELGDTVQALAEKTDVKAQARDRMAAVKDTAQEKKDEFVFKAKHARRIRLALALGRSPRGSSKSQCPLPRAGRSRRAGYSAGYSAGGNRAR
jgi:hypothetical protein